MVAAGAALGLFVVRRLWGCSLRVSSGGGFVLSGGPVGGGFVGPGFSRAPVLFVGCVASFWLVVVVWGWSPQVVLGGASCFRADLSAGPSSARTSLVLRSCSRLALLRFGSWLWSGGVALMACLVRASSPQALLAAGASSAWTSLVLRACSWVALLWVCSLFLVCGGAALGSCLAGASSRHAGLVFVPCSWLAVSWVCLVGAWVCIVVSLGLGGLVPESMFELVFEVGKITIG